MKMKQIISFFLAALILGTRVGFALNVHYCGAEIASVSFANNPSNCGMEMSKKKETPSKKNITKKSCCKDTTLLLQNDEPLKLTAESVTIDSSFIQTAFFTDCLNYTIPVLPIIENKNWNPPPPNDNNIILMQHRLVLYS